MHASPCIITNTEAIITAHIVRGKSVPYSLFLIYNICIHHLLMCKISKFYYFSTSSNDLVKVQKLCKPHKNEKNTYYK